jgi:hypothetical protein
MIETDGDWDDCQADPFDAWLTVENYDLNVVGDNDKERIIHVYPSDGIIYGELIKEFGLTADEEFDCATLVVIATKETKPDE